MNTLGLVADRVIKCNVCGLEHPVTNLHRDVTPLKRAQMACDDLEKVVEYFQMTPMVRQSIRVLFLDLRDKLGIPRERFFENNLFEMSVAFFAEIDPARVKKDMDDKRKVRSYIVSAEQKIKGRKILEELQKMIEDSVHMRDMEYAVFLEVLKDKKKLLKLE